MALHFTLPWILFLALEEGSRCKITGLLNELELCLLPCEMKRCILRRRLRALWFGSWGYLTFSKTAFVLCCSFLQSPSFSLSLYPLCSVTSTWLVRDVVALATGRISQPAETLKERQETAVFVTKNLLTRWQRCWWTDYNLAQGF